MKSPPYGAGAEEYDGGELLFRRLLVFDALILYDAAAAITEEIVGSSAMMSLSALFMRFLMCETVPTKHFILLYKKRVTPPAEQKLKT